MAYIHEVQAAILEIQVYEALEPGDRPVEVTASLLDLQSDVLPCAKSLRQRGARAFGFLSFEAASPGLPSRGVLWVQSDNGVELMPEEGNSDHLDDPGLGQPRPQVFNAATAKRALETSPLSSLVIATCGGFLRSRWC